MWGTWFAGCGSWATVGHVTHTSLIPLTLTMPGWPVAEPPSALLIFALLVGIPLAIGAVIAVFAAGPWLVRRSRGGDIQEGVEALWLGSSADEDPKALAAEADGNSVLVKSVSTPGGTSVRW